MKLKWIAVLVLYLVLPTWASTASAKAPKITPACTTEASCFKADVQYQLSENRPVKVCYNYNATDWRYRTCRRQAQSLFKERCKAAQKQLRQAQGATLVQQQQLAERYCIDFRP